MKLYYYSFEVTNYHELSKYNGRFASEKVHSFLTQNLQEFVGIENGYVYAWFPQRVLEITFNCVKLTLVREANTEKDKLESDLSQLAMQYLNGKQFNNLLIVAEKLLELKDDE